MTPTLPTRIAVGGDHAGFPLKRIVVEKYGAVVTSLIDCGCHDENSTDYPDFAVAVAREILSGKADKGILVCGSGVGVSVAANKIAGIRASICHDSYSAHQGVEHDDMNVLCIGARVIGPELAFEIIAGRTGLDGGKQRLNPRGYNARRNPLRHELYFRRCFADNCWLISTPMRSNPAPRTVMKVKSHAHGKGGGHGSGAKASV